MPANLENPAVVIGLERVSFHFNPKERQCSNHHTIALISQASKVMLKILQARLQQYANLPYSILNQSQFLQFCKFISICPFIFISISVSIALV